MRDLKNNLAIAISLACALRTADATGSSVDIKGYEAALVQVQSGAITDGTHTFTVKESDNNTDFTAVAAEHLLGTLPALGASDDNEVHTVGYIGNKRYLRVDVAVAGATTGGLTAATIIRGEGRHRGGELV